MYAKWQQNSIYASCASKAKETTCFLWHRSSKTRYNGVQTIETHSVETMFIRDHDIWDHNHLRPHSFETTFIWDHIHLRPHSFETTFETCSFELIYIWDHVHLRPQSFETSSHLRPVHLRPQSFETTFIWDLFIWDHIHLSSRSFETTFIWDRIQLRPQSF